MRGTQVQVRGAMRIRPGIELASLSDVGCQRQNNEDRHSYWEPESEEEFRPRENEGEHRGGEGSTKHRRLPIEHILLIT